MSGIHLVILSASALEGPTWDPPTLSWAELTDEPTYASRGRAALSAALTSHGLVQLSGLPGYKFSRASVLESLRGCASSSNGGASHTFPDGTVRKTFATHTLPTRGMVPIAVGVGGGGGCEQFLSAAEGLRAMVNEATSIFSERLSELLDLDGSPLLVTPSGRTFETFADVVHSGERLEHFHTYEKEREKTYEKEVEKTYETEVEKRVEVKRRDVGGPSSEWVNTIDLHTDQGLFIAFTPGAIVSDAGDALLSTGFLAQTADGVLRHARLDGDSLVFMLGDAAEKIVNPRLASHPLRLRALPHSLHMPSTEAGEGRTWYGMMVLPPEEALVPGGSMAVGEMEQVRQTYGAQRRALNDAHGTNDEACAQGTIYCWNRCMNATEDGGITYGVSEEICTAEGLSLQCVSPLDHLYNASFRRHGDFYPACTASTTYDAGTPLLESLPRDLDLCSDEAFASFSARTGFEHSIALGDDGVAMWNVLTDQEKDTSHTTHPIFPICRTPFPPYVRNEFSFFVFFFVLTDPQGVERIQLKMVYNGLFGWLAFGLRNVDVDAGHNGMNGAQIVMALPGEYVSAQEGLDLTKPGSVLEYQIHPTQSRFRYWGGPHPTEYISGASYDSTECFSSMEFTTHTIGGQRLQIDASDDIIWAANRHNRFVEYHGRGRGESEGSRGILEVTWKGGSSAKGSSAKLVSIAVGAALGGLVLLALAAYIFYAALSKPKKQKDTREKQANGATPTSPTTQAADGGAPTKELFDDSAVKEQAAV